MLLKGELFGGWTFCDLFSELEATSNYAFYHFEVNCTNIDTDISKLLSAVSQPSGRPRLIVLLQDDCVPSILNQVSLSISQLVTVSFYGLFQPGKEKFYSCAVWFSQYRKSLFFVGFLFWLIFKVTDWVAMPKSARIQHWPWAMSSW